ncbi:MAG: nucleotidyltransferase [Methylotenera sp. 24-45-7]|jgi:uncharacterized protein with HEPN domain|nr:MAG: nucleotidyltransferase [Mehylophilales bacterium 35-46-6]OYZ41055.1 MAG: nucleotidyltransferase [Methylotenera sp. 24-45-7]OZA10027.1 MAG: nucleotidyltransferase [Methylotenera sp. 17-45-7]OZA53894.1 MAG: nucleotidyltransferase [Methylophilales bacterium 39-45-7]HQS36809.1 DUF86 domain-containing protein [Methylotenera sp.]
MSEREWRFYISDMIRFSETAISYTDGMDQQQFINSRITYDATLRNLELIGEAATHIPQEVRDQYTNIPWQMMIATRNQLIHGYLGIDNDILWNIIHQDSSLTRPTSNN